MLKSKYKKIIISAIAVLVVIALGVYFYKAQYIPAQKRASELQEFRKSLYDSVLCEYKCPLTLQKYKNTTQLLPEQNCVQTCTADFKVKSEIINVTQIELNSDPLIKDISKVISACKSASIGQNNTLNNTFFFNCSVEEIDKLKDNYNYLTK